MPVWSFYMPLNKHRYHALHLASCVVFENKTPQKLSLKMIDFFQTTNVLSIASKPTLVSSTAVQLRLQTPDFLTRSMLCLQNTVFSVMPPNL